MELLSLTTDARLFISWFRRFVERPLWVALEVMGQECVVGKWLRHQWVIEVNLPANYITSRCRTGRVSAPEHGSGYPADCFAQYLIQSPSRRCGRRRIF